MSGSTVGFWIKMDFDVFFRRGGKGDKYKHKSEVVSYDQAKDQTIKRKKESVEETTPAKKVKKEVKEEPSTESMDVTTEETPTKSKKVITIESYKRLSSPHDVTTKK